MGNKIKEVRWTVDGVVKKKAVDLPCSSLFIGGLVKGGCYAPRNILKYVPELKADFEVKKCNVVELYDGETSTSVYLRDAVL